MDFDEQQPSYPPDNRTDSETTLVRDAVAS